MLYFPSKQQEGRPGFYNPSSIYNDNNHRNNTITRRGRADVFFFPFKIPKRFNPDRHETFGRPPLAANYICI